MIWVGGGPGAGKSTLSWLLSRAHDLPLHPVDMWAYDHDAQLPPFGAGPRDLVLAEGGEVAADFFAASNQPRLPLVLADVVGRELGPVPAIVEGPQLLPEFAAELAPGWCVWLLPHPVRSRKVWEERAVQWKELEPHAKSSIDVVAGRPRAELLAERDVVLTSRISVSAARLGRPVIPVPRIPDWASIFTAIESTLAPALKAAPRLTPGPELRRQRRYENAVAVRQGRLWAEAQEFAQLPTYRYGCECGTSGCRAMWRATPDEYEARTASGDPLVAHEAA